MPLSNCLLAIRLAPRPSEKPIRCSRHSKRCLLGMFFVSLRFAVSRRNFYGTRVAVLPAVAANVSSLSGCFVVSLRDRSIELNSNAKICDTQAADFLPLSTMPVQESSLEDSGSVYTLCRRLQLGAGTGCNTTAFFYTTTAKTLLKHY